MNTLAQQKFNSERWKWFTILKAGEILGIASSTVGAYFYGVLFYFLINRPLDHWLIVWLVGLSMFVATLAILALVFYILKGFIMVN